MAEHFSEKEIAELKKVFNLFDKDGDGCISIKDLRDVLTSMGENFTEEQLQKMIKKLDADGNGIVDFEEFLALKPKTMKDLLAEQKYLLVFKSFDKNRDGLISIDELKWTLENFGKEVSDADVEQFLKEADLDHDGKINYDEFIKFTKGKCGCGKE